MANNNELNMFLAIAFLFFAGAMIGWVIEFLFRNLISHSGPRGKYFINPGFCHGPYLPIYGIGLSVMFIISYVIQIKIENPPKLLVILLICVVMTVIEFIGGIFLLKVLNMRLWDYRDMPGNFMGIICPTFTLIWGAIGAAYYLLIHPIALNGLVWLSHNLSFCFVIGLFFGVFIVDLVQSSKEAKAIRDYGNDNNVVVKYEELRQAIMQRAKELGHKVGFFSRTAQKTDVADALKQAPAEVTIAKKDAAKSTRKKNKSKNGRK